MVEAIVVVTSLRVTLVDLVTLVTLQGVGLEGSGTPLAEGSLNPLKKNGDLDKLTLPKVDYPSSVPLSVRPQAPFTVHYLLTNNLTLKLTWLWFARYHYQSTPHHLLIPFTHFMIFHLIKSIILCR